MLRGHSGCDITQSGGLVWKTAVDYPKERLIAQARKQQAFASLLCCDLQVPAVHFIGKNCFSMDYVPSHNILEFLELASPRDVDRFIDIILEYFAKIAKTIEYVDISKLVQDKYNEVGSKYPIPQFVERHFTGQLCILPLSLCHGDLSLSNVMFSPGFKTIYFVDWLDSFANSSAIDYIKLRQDYRWFWTHHLMGIEPTARHRSIFRYLDCRFRTALAGMYDDTSIHQVEILNFLRILPYSKDNRTQDYILRVLEELCL